MFRKQGLFICGAFLASVLLSLFQAQALTVATLNIANYDDHLQWSNRVVGLANAIAQCNPDVIALQETRFNPDEASTRASYQNQAEEILYLLNQKGLFQDAVIDTQPSMYYSGGKISPRKYPLPASMNNGTASIEWEGSTIISQLPILETGTVFLHKSASCSDLNLRTTQYVTVDIGSGRQLRLFNTHFGLDGPCLHDNVNDTLAYMHREGEDTALLVGDMNATPDNANLDPLRVGMSDLWTQLHTDTPGFTFPSNAPIKRIDYIWASKYVSLAAQAIDIFACEPDAQGVFPSDHCGLCAKFSL